MANKLQVRVYRDGKPFEQIERLDYGIGNDFNRLCARESKLAANNKGIKSVIELFDAGKNAVIHRVSINSI